MVTAASCTRGVLPRGVALRSRLRIRKIAVEDIFGTKLLQATRAGYEKLAVELLASGANPDSKDSYGFALTQAIRAGSEKLAFKLLASGANPDSEDSYGFAITQAKVAGLDRLEKELLNQGATATPLTQKSAGFSQLTINATLPPDVLVSISTRQRTILIGSSHGAITACKASAGFASNQAFGNLA